MGKPRILIVDDDRTTLWHLTELIQDAGYDALPAPTWSEALQIFRQSSPDLALLDVMMPTIDGFKLARILKSESEERFVPIILLTALDDAASKQRGMASGADDFLTKPVGGVELSIRLKSMLRIKELTDQLQTANRRLAELAVTDPLTKIANRRSVNDALGREYARHRRYEHPLSVFMLDLDNFKAVNDEHGHGVGDAVLVLTASILRMSTRETDVVGRFGGEEFVILAPETCARDARVMGERIRTKLASESEAAANLPKVTVSVGIVATDGIHRAAPEELLRLADGALYDAKRRGRNRCVLVRAESGDPADGDADSEPIPSSDA